jgi:hypothetical protein
VTDDQPDQAGFEQTRVLQLVAAGVLVTVLVAWILLAAVFPNL